MKGFVHFVSGLAAATCFPQAVEMAYRDKSFILAMGGIFGILPDTLDFKFLQFCRKYDYVVDPDPDNPDPQKIAQAIADAIHRAHDEQKTCSMVLMTIKKSADLWRQYKVGFDTKTNEVVVTIGPIVNTSQKAYPETEMDLQPCRIKLDCPLDEKLYMRDVFIDIMNGPSLNFVPIEDNKVKMDFIPWHRGWTHSLLFGVLLGAIVWLIAAIWGGLEQTLVYGLVVTSGFWVHILEDQLGYMGSNLFWPMTHGKIPGMKLMHSADAWPNFMAVWVALTLIFYNLNNYAPTRVFDANIMVYMAYAVIAPLMTIRIIELALRKLEAAT